MNEAEKIQLVTSIVKAEKEKITRFLAENIEISAADLAKEMVFIGVPVFYVALVTGIPAEEINRLKNVIH